MTTEDNEHRSSSDETNAVSDARKVYDDLKAHFSAAGSGVVGEFEEAGNASESFVTHGTRRCRILFADGGALLSFQDEVALVDKGSENVAMTLVLLPFAELVKAIDLWLAGASLEDLQRHWPSVRPSVLAGAYAFLDYFEGHERAQPDEQHWCNGVAVCRRWVQLLRTGATPADIDEMIDRLNAPEPDAGLGWLQLRAQFFHWARARGFTVRTGEDGYQVERAAY